MIQEFVDAFIAKKETLFTDVHPESYQAIVRAVVEVLTPEDEYDRPDPNRIHEIDDGDYQGTLVYVIGATGYQPSDYWFVKVSYGSCSGCDTLEGIRDYSDETPTPEQTKDYQTLALHIVQGLREMSSSPPSEADGQR